MNKVELETAFRRRREQWEQGKIEHNEYALHLDEMLTTYLRLRKTRMSEVDLEGAER